MIITQVKGYVTKYEWRTDRYIGITGNWSEVSIMTPLSSVPLVIGCKITEEIKEALFSKKEVILTVSTKDSDEM